MQLKTTILGVAIGVTAMGMSIPGCSPKASDKNQPMSQGEKLYRGNCATCHRLLAPEEHDGPTWEAYIEKYGKRLSPEEKKLVYNFLTGQEETTDANGVSEPL
jgi:cytochrome c5